MNLRARLVLGVIATAVPLSIGLALVEARLERNHGLERVADVARARMAGDMRERCERAPEVFPEPRVREDDLLLDDVLGLIDVPEPRRRPTPPPHGPRMFAYDASYRSSNPHAPRLPQRLVRALSRGEDAATVVERHGRHRVERALVRMSWSDGPCALVLVEHPEPPERVRARLFVPLVVALAVVLAMLLVAGPLVRRLTRLREAMKSGDVSRLRDERRDEIGELTRTFVQHEARIREQVEAIEGRERALREYIANTTHDVLAPVAVLTTQLAEIEALSRAGEALPSGIALSALEETQYLAALVHNLNAQARLEGGIAAKMDDVDLGAVVERAVARHVPLASRLGVALDFAVPETRVFVRGDVTLIEQALSNLVGNAVRYNTRGGHVAVVLEATRTRFSLTVRDDGEGVPDDALARLGERGFRTTEARTRRPEGMGLGLHIVREVAALHGFALNFSHSEPKGLTVTLEGQRAEMVP